MSLKVMHRLRSGKTFYSASATRPHSEEIHDSATDVRISLSPPILWPPHNIFRGHANASNSESLIVADTMLNVGTEVIAHKPARQYNHSKSLLFTWHGHLSYSRVWLARRRAA